MVHDVIVLGATVAGLTVARRLGAEGYDVMVLDPNPEGLSAGIGHGVAAVGHASTVAAMAHAYGIDNAREHLRRNLAAMAEIRTIHPAHDALPLRDRSLPGGDERETRAVADLFRQAGTDVELLLAPDGAALRSEAILVDPLEYAGSLKAAALAAGARVVHSVTVTHVRRREGVTEVGFRQNLAWARERDATTGMAVIDTVGVSPWGRAARIGPTQWVPVLRGTPRRPLREVALTAIGPAWLQRPVDGRAMVLGHKTSEERLAGAVTELRAWATDALGMSDIETGRLAIDPSDHGRPVVGASAIPGGFYACGNGRGELMNGTASGYYLAGLLTGSVGSGHALPPLSRLRAYGARHRRR